MEPNRTPYRAKALQNSLFRLYVGMGMLTLIVLVPAIFALVQLRSQAKLKAHVTARSLSKSIELTFTGMIDTIDMAMQHAVDDVEKAILERRSAETINSLLLRHEKRLFHSIAIRAANEHGDIAYGKNASPPFANISDRNHFVFHKGNPNRELYISQPTFSRIDNIWVWIFTRRINHPDGAFAGIVYAALPISEIARTFKEIKLDSGSTIRFRDSRLNLVLSYVAPEIMHFPDEDKGSLDKLHFHLASNPVEGSYFNEVAPIDGIARFYSYQISPKYKFLVNVGIAADTALAGWRRQATFVVLLIGTFFIALLVFTALIRRTWLRADQVLSALQSSKSSLRDSQQSLHEAQQLARLGRFQFELQSGIWRSSDVLDEIFGIGPDYRRDMQGWLNLIAPEFQEEIKACLSMTESSSLPADREFRIVRHNDAQERWVHCKAVLHLDPEGKPSVFAGTVQDITGIKRSELEILSSRNRLEALTNQLIQAQEQERKRLAHELHDELGQRFTSLNITLHNLKKPQGMDEANGSLQKAIEDVAYLIHRVRDLSDSLRPPMLDYLGLEASIRQLLQEHFTYSGMEFVFEYAGLPHRLPASVEITIYRIIQEAITNIVRHARASQVVVELNGGEDGKELELIIRDNGQGFDPDKVLERASRSGIGLMGMRERAALLGGTFNLKTEIGGGTRIDVSLPL